MVGPNVFDATKETNLTMEQRQTTDRQASAAQSFKGRAMLRCTQCGSSRIRTYGTPLLVAIVAFTFLWLMPQLVLLVGLVFQPEWLLLVFFASIFALMFFPFVFLLTVSFALVGKHRCKDCGHHFRAGDEIEQIRHQARFPVSYSVFSAVILFLGFVVGPVVSMRVSGGIYAPADLKIIVLLVGWSLAAGLCILHQAVVYRLLKARIRSPLKWAVLFLLPVLVLTSLGVHHYLPKVRVQKILAEGGFAPLPKSATHLRVYGWWCPDELGRCMMFRATPQDVEEFLNTSPTLKGRKCQKFSPERMRILFPRDTTKWMEYTEAGHELFGHSSGPLWYKEEIRSYGRYYSVPTKDYRKSCEVIVDDEKNIVYIKVIWG